MRPMAMFLSALLSLQLLTACGGGATRQSSLPPVDDSVRGTQTYPAPNNGQQARKGFSTGQKVAVLAGAAALYYIYNQHKNKQEQGSQGKYYLSKNGRVYYRDEQGRAHWVTPPKEGIRVPEQQAQAYRDFQGYNGQENGRTLVGLGTEAGPM